MDGNYDDIDSIVDHILLNGRGRSTDGPSQENKNSVEGIIKEKEESETIENIVDRLLAGETTTQTNHNYYNNDDDDDHYNVYRDNNNHHQHHHDEEEEQEDENNNNYNNNNNTRLGSREVPVSSPPLRRPPPHTSASSSLLGRFQRWQERKEARRLQLLYETLYEEKNATPFCPVINNNSNNNNISSSTVQLPQDDRNRKEMERFARRLEEGRRRREAAAKEEEAYVNYLRDFSTFENKTTTVVPFNLCPKDYKGNGRARQQQQQQRSKNKNHNRNHKEVLYSSVHTDPIVPVLREELLFSSKMNSQLNKTVSSLTDKINSENKTIITTTTATITTPPPGAFSLTMESQKDLVDRL